MKMIIVDDEIGVANAIKRLYDWSQLEIDEVFVYESARDALEKLKERDLYILMTDIMMPEINGLELTRLAVEMNPDIQIIIFSGYDDFKYAQEAMRAGAREYLLKPVSLEEVIAAVRRAAENAAAENELSEYDRKNEKNMFANLLINESVHLSETKFRDYMDLIKFDGKPQWCLCFCVKITDCKKRSDWNTENDLPILYVAVDNVLNEILEGKGSSFNNNTNSVTAFLFGTQQDDYGKIISECKSVLQQTLDISAAIGVGTAEEFSGNMSKSYKEALTACEHCAQYSKPEILCFSDLHFQFGYPQEIETALLSELEKGENVSKQRLSEIISRYFADIKMKSNIPAYYAENICDRMFFACLKKAESFGIDIGDETRHEIKKNTDNIDGLERRFTEGLEKIATAMQSKSNDKNKMLTETVKQYIGKNLDKDLSLDTVSKQFHFSSRYFAHIFKQYTGGNYTAYVNGVRMEEAKRLLKMSDLTINEIAGRVGYGDMGHFSRNFKSVVGKRPSEYRRERT